MHADKKKVIEGELRCQALKEHLIENDAPLSIYLSEDGSGLVKRVVYDVKTNQLVGIVLPLNQNGMPRTFAYTPTSASQIEELMKLSQSGHVYIMVAQPLASNASPFILQMFGTDSKFKADDVLKRWAYTEKELERYIQHFAKDFALDFADVYIHAIFHSYRHGIDVIGYASDGDPRLLSAMKRKINFSLVDLTEDELKYCSLYNTIKIFVQDMIHIGTKLRNRLLKELSILAMGNKIVSIAHLKILLKNVSKNIHGLVRSDICPQDLQNYASLEKVMHDRCIKAMEENIIDSEATVMYLKLCKMITSSFLDENMNVNDRIYNIWHANYFFRAWRKWIKSADNDYTIKDNFISSNAYSCIEINAHSMIYAILKLRNEGKTEMFQTHLFSSQPCEHMFRHMRSMGTANFTKINFTLYELLHMISRVELMQNIAHMEWDNGSISFPNKKNSRQHGPMTSPIKLPSDSEIIAILKNAREDALEKAKQFGIVLQSESIAKCELREQEFSEYMSSEEDVARDDDDHIIGSDGLNQASNVAPNTDINPFVYVENEDGSFKEIRKSTMVWLLTEYKEKLSAERLQRVQTTPHSGVAKRPKLDISSQPLAQPGSSSSCISAELNICKRLPEIQIGQWCVFRAAVSKSEKSPNSTSNSNKLKNLVKNYIIGAVTGFKCLNEKNSGENKKNKKPNKKFFGIDSAHTSKENYGKVEVLASWYSFDSDGILHPVSSRTCYYVPISFYLATITAPKYGRNENVGINHLVLSVSVLDLQNELKKLLEKKV